ncbi:MAG: hypothetical protein AB2809_13835 [Candidatus Thiodiazotropha sp.]
MRADTLANTNCDKYYNSQYPSNLTQRLTISHSSDRVEVFVFTQEGFIDSLRKKGLLAKAAEVVQDLRPYVKSGIPALDKWKPMFTALKDFGFTVSQSQYRMDGNYIIFKGYAGFRKYITTTRYLVNNSKVLHLQVGKLGGSKAFSTYSPITVILIGGEAFNHIIRGEYSEAISGFLFDSATSLITGQIARFAAARIAQGIGAGAVKIVAGTVAAPIVAGVLIAISVGALITYMDEKHNISKRFDRAFKETLDDIARQASKAGQDLEYLNTPEGAMWLMRYLTR